MIFLSFIFEWCLSSRKRAWDGWMHRWVESRSSSSPSSSSQGASSFNIQHTHKTPVRCFAWHCIPLVIHLNVRDKQKVTVKHAHKQSLWRGFRAWEFFFLRVSIAITNPRRLLIDSFLLLFVFEITIIFFKFLWFRNRNSIDFSFIQMAWINWVACAAV